MPTKTYKRVSGRTARPFQPSATELFPREICRRMAQALDIADPHEITRLHGILNDAGSGAHIATFLKKEGVPAANQQAALKGLRRLRHPRTNVARQKGRVVDRGAPLLRPRIAGAA